MTQTFFGSSEEDDRLEASNQEFWRSLLGYIRTEVPPTEVTSLLDIGCHHGGLLELLAKHFQPRMLLGLEPLATARNRAMFRLKGLAREVQILDTSRWSTIPTASLDLATAHEVLHLIGSLEGFMGSLARVLRPAGRAFIVLGCHSENPMWERWKPQIAALGHKVFDHSPMDVLREASRAGFHTSIRPLRRDGWVIYDPLTVEFQYPSVAEMLDHQYRHKLVFRLLRDGGQVAAR